MATHFFAAIPSDGFKLTSRPKDVVPDHFVSCLGIVAVVFLENLRLAIKSQFNFFCIGIGVDSYFRA